MELVKEFELIFNRKISALNEIDSIELVILVNTLNSKYLKTVDIFDVVKCSSLIELNDIFFR